MRKVAVIAAIVATLTLGVAGVLATAPYWRLEADAKQEKLSQLEILKLGRGPLTQRAAKELIEERRDAVWP